MVTAHMETSHVLTGQHDISPKVEKRCQMASVVITMNHLIPSSPPRTTGNTAKEWKLGRLTKFTGRTLPLELVAL
jgi:hypothetical protein